MKYTKEERLNIIIRSGKVIGDNVNNRDNGAVILFDFNLITLYKAFK